MGCNPNLERLHCFQYEQNCWCHCRVVAALMLTFGVNGPLRFIHSSDFALRLNLQLRPYKNKGKELVNV